MLYKEYKGYFIEGRALNPIPDWSGAAKLAGNITFHFSTGSTLTLNFALYAQFIIILCIGDS